MTTFDLKGKVIVITGATGILGKAFVEGIAAAGGAVVIAGRNEKIAKEREEQVNAKGGQALSIIADVTKEDDLAAGRDKILDRFGRIDGLVNAAGGNIKNAIIQKDMGLFDLDIAALRQVMDLNLMGTVLPTQVFGKVIAENGGGSIVNISSMASQRAITRVLGYSLAKSAIDAYTKWFAMELGNRYGDAVRMNAIAPGFFLTEQNRDLLTTPEGGMTERGAAVVQHTPFKRLGTPPELNGALIWLLSDASRFVTGTVINVDGGFSIFSGV
ncbi:SDR family oxidoreductase [Niabella drilacis]|uniref:NAD(P)-dependent dehydrogenase, short-chain alcohol dehydrogenase family n=1 Tax=Niabella drilacis (strain DSM 25811 / CCM 8410 / CCUG 62505 / LMG 26954 / E90) TaxID=1285928 RepID=A0A1G6L6Q2_NIADE|nr:SDR family oxidoreductase [Niabella drilacis]SDC38435.1 NAD(P)-dependent dehydrogenase, short-chain alcohol dehydrogenase family [Niabella drilacis]